MANDLGTLSGLLATKLSDEDHKAWASTEKDELIIRAVGGLYPRYVRPMHEPIWPVSTEIEDYPLPAGMIEVTRVDTGEVATDTLLDHMPEGTWEIQGDPNVGTGVLHINRHYLLDDYYLILHGFGRYDLTANLIPDDLVALVLEKATSEAWRRALGERMRFKQWAAGSQVENVSVNEMVSIIATSDRRVDQLMSMYPRTQRKPVPARV